MLSCQAEAAAEVADRSMEKTYIADGRKPLNTAGANVSHGDNGRVPESNDDKQEIQLVAESGETDQENCHANANDAMQLAKPFAADGNGCVDGVQYTDNIEMGVIPDDYLVGKHPLQNVWTLWYLEKDRNKAWEDMQNEITSFHTVEDFWSLYNHIKPPSEIKVGSDYSMFKKHIRPMWEDPANKLGGRWVITLPKAATRELDRLWVDVLLCLIGEAFDHSDEVCGAVVNIRGKNNKVSIWTAHGDNTEAAMEIGHKLRDSLQLHNTNLQYELHKDTMVKQDSNVHALYTL